MKKITLFHFEGCPYCQEARRWIEELRHTCPELQKVELTLIDEKLHPEIADRYDYYYVPTFYVGDEKAHEGACTREIVEKVLRMGLN